MKSFTARQFMMTATPYAMLNDLLLHLEGIIGDVRGTTEE